MTQSVSGNIRIIANLTVAQAIGLADGELVINEKISQDFSDGAADDQAHMAWSSLQRSIAASGSEDLDLNASLSDGFGNSLTLTKLKFLLIKASPLNANDLVIGAAGSHPLAIFGTPATDTLHIKPGGTLVLIAPKAAGYPVVAATSDVLTVANGGSGTAVLYDIIVAGA